MVQALPSLVALRAFEAAARHRSLTRAAEELCVTHGAVSRHVKALEAALGVPLMRRGALSSDPTPEGACLAEGLTAAFGLIQATIERVTPGPLTLSCSASIMLCWLIPRMSAFHAVHGDVQVELNTKSRNSIKSRDLAPGAGISPPLVAMGYFHAIPHPPSTKKPAAARPGGLWAVSGIGKAEATGIPVRRIGG
ncbi:LysR family transcriptional regulator [Methylobacterium nodulans]|uniref:Transcriptional regulator, LysR family n=1 Tax=Methylobacterium nodulans (strain LMG 21967 / CNCM I-2342 / ORS 2060) TaxID=460265 RepID=B8IBH9_METNO|nr:LysR family transcriptional regulator [Methylobacterium nodulans]ACL57394.1 transcriptional regulator, LysR family [Methylobacterium nodulans ORS 2060]